MYNTLGKRGIFEELELSKGHPNCLPPLERLDLPEIFQKR